LGLTNYPVRILAIEEDDSGILTLTAEEFTAGVATPVLYPTKSASSTIPNRGATPAAVHTPLIYEPPPAVTSGVPQIWVGASGGAPGAFDPNWGGAFVWVSLDNVTYVQVGTITQPVAQGFLTAALALGTGYDTTNVLSVNLAESGRTLSGTTMASAQQGVTLALIDNELLAYATATLTAPHVYNLTGLARGLYGTTPAPHASGAAFARLGPAIVKYDLPSSYIGKTLFLKMQSVNVFGGGAQDLSTCAAYVCTPTGGGGLSPIAGQLATGLPLDLGFVTATPVVSDDFGSPVGAVLGAVSLGAIS
jgi:hypothetical protein